MASLDCKTTDDMNNKYQVSKGMMKLNFFQNKGNNQAKNGTRRAQIPRKSLFFDYAQMNKNAE